MNKALVLYSNYTKFEFEMIDDECVVDDNKISISDALMYAEKLSYPYNLLRADIFTVAHVSMPDGKVKDIYTLLRNLKIKKEVKESDKLAIEIIKILRNASSLDIAKDVFIKIDKIWNQNIFGDDNNINDN